MTLTTFQIIRRGFVCLNLLPKHKNLVDPKKTVVTFLVPIIPTTLCSKFQYITSIMCIIAHFHTLFYALSYFIFRVYLFLCLFYTFYHKYRTSFRTLIRIVFAAATFTAVSSVTTITTRLVVIAASLTAMAIVFTLSWLKQWA